ncbi:membrane protein [Amylibacter ulvae]|uniref:Membrane protein n=1 Tax=Paramylibacter ulvae TaxID=1651968 RepID=A0ABQ3D1W5_9RHOB|nr:EamA family transporter [Amylibacter ulvae]GHA54425.1 membrane protein [Amylibacter ulvae]
MALWIPITIGAAFAQNLRFMLQKHLRATGLSTGGATFARFVFAFPLAGILAGALLIMRGETLPTFGARFWIFSSLGGLSQIIATMCVVALFAQRNFAVGITFKKTEVVLAAIFGFVVLGDRISTNGFLAIIVGLIGVIILSDKPDLKSVKKWYHPLWNKSAALGITSGALFGFSGIAYRGASLSLGHGDFLLRATITLACVTAFQTLVMAIFLWVKEQGELQRVFAAWRVTALVGLTGMIGSWFWFMAFTLQNAAYVKALGQIELVFTFIGSYFVFKERNSTRELIGIALVVLSILLLVLWR